MSGLVAIFVDGDRCDANGNRTDRWATEVELLCDLQVLTVLIVLTVLTLGWATEIELCDPPALHNIQRTASRRPPAET